MMTIPFKIAPTVRFTALLLLSFLLVACTTPVPNSQTSNIIAEPSTKVFTPHAVLTIEPTAAKTPTPARISPTPTKSKPSSTPKPTSLPTKVPKPTETAQSTMLSDSNSPTQAQSACPNGCASHQPGCDIKGNINNKGVKIYHMPHQAYYDQTKISPEKGERWFCTPAEAEANGWRPSKK